MWKNARNCVSQHPKRDFRALLCCFYWPRTQQQQPHLRKREDDGAETKKILSGVDFINPNRRKSQECSVEVSRWTFFSNRRTRVRWSENKSNKGDETRVATSCFTCGFPIKTFSFDDDLHELIKHERVERQSSHFTFRRSLRCGDYRVNYSFLP